MSFEASEKTEQPSDYRLREARKKGQVAKSADISALLSLAFALLVVMAFSSFMLDKMTNSFRSIFVRDLNKTDLLVVMSHARASLDALFGLALPMLFAAGVGALVGNLAQFGFLFSLDPIKFDIKKIDPIAGAKKLLAKTRLIELIKQSAKFATIFWVIYLAVKNALGTLALLVRVDLSISLLLIADLIKLIFLRVMLCFLVIALVDFFWQRWSFFKSMRMTKHEVKKEFIQQEGDPEIKLERRRIQQESLEALSSANVVDASVVITNPSHLAVALRYQEPKDLAPRVIAKGVGKNAKAIIGEARRMTIPIMRNVPLARDLQWLEIDEEIPVRLYDSVAEVLTFINELNEKNSGDTT